MQTGQLNHTNIVMIYATIQYSLKMLNTSYIWQHIFLFFLIPLSYSMDFYYDQETIQNNLGLLDYLWPSALLLVAGICVIAFDTAVIASSNNV
jgi:hypothetical protein